MLAAAAPSPTHALYGVDADCQRDRACIAGGRAFLTPAEAGAALTPWQQHSGLGRLVTSPSMVQALLAHLYPDGRRSRHQRLPADAGH